MKETGPFRFQTISLTSFLFPSSHFCCNAVLQGLNKAKRGRKQKEAEKKGTNRDNVWGVWGQLWSVCIGEHPGNAIKLRGDGTRV